MTKDQIVAALLNACPGARDRWEEYVTSWGTDERGLYNDVGVFALHIVESYRRRKHAGASGVLRRSRNDAREHRS